MSNEWQYYLFKCASKLISLLPYRIVLTLGKLLGVLYYRVAAKQRKRAEQQIKEAMQLQDEKAEKIIKSLFIKLAQTFLEVLHTPALSEKNIEKYVEIENRHYLDEALAQKKGVVLLTAHMGNWEWLGAGLALNGFPMATVVKPQPNDQHTRILNEYRQLVGIEIFSRGGSELVGAAKALKKGKVLGFLADQDAGVNGVAVSFFGKTASTPLGPAVFARRFSSPVVPIFIVRKPHGGHRVIMHPCFYYEDTGNEDRDLYNLTLKMTAVTEEIIRAHPDEWLWFQKRWLTKLNQSPETVRVGDEA